jgi:hypothetical protein
VFAHQLALSLDNARLHDELAHKIAELVATREQLIQGEKLALTGQLAGSVAHEINNPLTFILDNLEVLREYAAVVTQLWQAAEGAGGYLRAQPDPESQLHADRLLAPRGAVVDTIVEVVDSTLGGVERIAELVRGFWRFADDGRSAPPAEACDLDEVIRECTSGLHGVAFHAQAAPGRAALVVRDDLRTTVRGVIAFLGSRTDHTSGRPCIVLSNPTVTLSEPERRRIFDPRLEVDARKGRSVRFGMDLPIAYLNLLRGGAEISLSDPSVHGIAFQIVLPAAP